MSMRRSLAVLLSIVLLPHLARAQAPSSRPTFDVASVKINKSDDRRKAMRMDIPDNLIFTNQVLNALISIAYRVPPGRMTGGPSWLTTERFDIAAKAVGPAPLDERMAML